MERSSLAEAHQQGPGHLTGHTGCGDHPGPDGDRAECLHGGAVQPGHTMCHTGEMISIFI